MLLPGKGEPHMKHPSRAVLFLAMALAPAWAPARANCAAIDSQPMWNGLAGSIVNCLDAQMVWGWAYLLTSPSTVNSNGQNFVCRTDGETLDYPAGAGVDCAVAAGSGSYGDGRVTLYYEWGIQNGNQAGAGTGAVGCPNPLQLGYGTSPLGIQVVCNFGAGLLLENGYSQDFQQYVLEFSYPV